MLLRTLTPSGAPLAHLHGQPDDASEASPGLHLRRVVGISGGIDRPKTVEQKGWSPMFTMMACAVVALVVLIERRRQPLNRNPAGTISTSRDYSRFGSYLPFAVLIALGVIVDRIHW